MPHEGINHESLIPKGTLLAEHLVLSLPTAQAGTELPLEVTSLTTQQRTLLFEQGLVPNDASTEVSEGVSYMNTAKRLLGHIDTLQQDIDEYYDPLIKLTTLTTEVISAAITTRTEIVGDPSETDKLVDYVRKLSLGDKQASADEERPAGTLLNVMTALTMLESAYTKRAARLEAEESRQKATLQTAERERTKLDVKTQQILLALATARTRYDELMVASPEGIEGGSTQDLDRPVDPSQPELPPFSIDAPMHGEGFVQNSMFEDSTQPETEVVTPQEGLPDERNLLIANISSLNIDSEQLIEDAKKLDTKIVELRTSLDRLSAKISTIKNLKLAYDQADKTKAVVAVVAKLVHDRSELEKFASSTPTGEEADIKTITDAVQPSFDPEIVAAELERIYSQILDEFATGEYPFTVKEELDFTNCVQLLQGEKNLSAAHNNISQTIRTFFEGDASYLQLFETFVAHKETHLETLTRTRRQHTNGLVQLRNFISEKLGVLRDRIYTIDAIDQLQIGLEKKQSVVQNYRDDLHVTAERVTEIQKDLDSTLVTTHEKKTALLAQAARFEADYQNAAAQKREIMYDSDHLASLPDNERQIWLAYFESTGGGFVDPRTLETEPEFAAIKAETDQAEASLDQTQKKLLELLEAKVVNRQKIEKAIASLSLMAEIHTSNTEERIPLISQLKNTGKTIRGIRPEYQRIRDLYPTSVQLVDEEIPTSSTRAGIEITINPVPDDETKQALAASALSGLAQSLYPMKWFMRRRVNHA